MLFHSLSGAIVWRELSAEVRVSQRRDLWRGVGEVSVWDGLDGRSVRQEVSEREVRAELYPRLWLSERGCLPSHDGALRVPEGVVRTAVRHAWVTGVSKRRRPYDDDFRAVFKLVL